ncbi:MAG: cytochrome P450 [Bacteroidia bacterium]|nr:cytochrome P450 [Bacteroidia bacterium]
MGAPANLKPYKSIPRHKGLGPLGNVRQIAKGMLPFLRRSREELGDLFAVDPPFKRLVIVSDPEIAKYVLQENNKNYLKSFGYKILRLFLGNGLLTNEGDDWRRQRRLAQPAFYKQALANLVADMADESMKIAQRWAEMAKNGVELDVDREMNEVTLRIVARSLFGADVGGKIEEISEAITTLNKFAMKRITNPFPLPTWFPNKTRKLFLKSSGALDKIIYDIIADRRRRGIEQHDLTGLLMAATYEETGEHMNDLQLRDELMTIFVAGHETTANAMAWAMYSVAQNPEIAQKIRQEAHEVLADRSPGFEDVRNLQYSLQVIEESMRMFPPAWVIGRKNIEADQFGEYHIPPNTNILVSVYEIHHHPKLWDSPETFNPDHFSPEKRKNIGKYAYFPFGGGPRLCIGNTFALMEMQILLSCILREVNLEVVEGHPVELEPIITLRPKHGIKLRLNPAG